MTATTVTVTVDPQSFQLTVTPSSLTLDSGQGVLWRFQGLPKGWHPGLQFQGPSLYGPFVEIRRQEGGVWGLGNTGIDGQISYVATIADQQGNEIRSAQATIINQSPARQSSLQLTVTVDLDDQSFFVVPFEAKLQPGGAVLWHFTNLPTGYAPAIRFTDVIPIGGTAPQPASWLGPFESLARSGQMILGCGHTGVGRFTYEIDVFSAVDASSAVRLGAIQSGDPIIDSEGDPPAPLPKPG